jgi:hypothetical protein
MHHAAMHHAPRTAQPWSKCQQPIRIKNTAPQHKVALTQGFPNFFLLCPPKSNKINIASPLEHKKSRPILFFHPSVLKKENLASPLPAPRVPLGGPVPKVGNPCSNTSYYLHICNMRMLLPAF